MRYTSPLDMAFRRIPADFTFAGVGAQIALYGRRWRFLLIDEYQDTNAGQYRLASIWRARSGTSMPWVMTINRFMGSEGRMSSASCTLRRTFLGPRVIRLEVNYRSSAEIVTLGHAVMAQARRRYPKRLVPALGPSVPVEWTRVASEDERGGLHCGGDYATPRRRVYGHYRGPGARRTGGRVSCTPFGASMCRVNGARGKGRTGESRS